MPDWGRMVSEGLGYIELNPWGVLAPGLAIVLVGCFIVDRGVYRAAGAAAWLGLRLQLTSVATLSCLLAAFRLG